MSDLNQNLSSKSIKDVVIAIWVVVSLFGCSNTGHQPAPTENHNIKKHNNANRLYRPITGKFYRIKKGDTLYAIAWRAGLDYQVLAQLNDIKAPFEIFPEQIIRLRPRSSQTSKIKVPTAVVKKNPIISPQNTAKTLAQQNQGEYGQSKLENKTTPRQIEQQQKEPNKKPQSRQSTPSSDTPYSNKIRRWVWPTQGKIIAAFSNKENGNKGIDNGGVSGTPIVSTADGKVVYYGNALRGYGNLIIIKHNDDYLSAYAHNRRVLVKEKEFVKAGQVIAEMGDTDSQDVKLHFEVRYRGKSVNPMKYLPKR